jgi:hypothetical protein
METQQQTWQNMNGKIFQDPITQLVEKAIIREQASGHRLKVCGIRLSRIWRSYQLCYGSSIHS